MPERRSVCPDTYIVLYVRNVDTITVSYALYSSYYLLLDALCQQTYRLTAIGNNSDSGKVSSSFQQPATCLLHHTLLFPFIFLVKLPTLHTQAPTTSRPRGSFSIYGAPWPITVIFDAPALSDEKLQGGLQVRTQLLND